MAEKKQHFWIDRRHTRIAAGLDCQVAPQQGEFLQVRMLNLSAGGFKFDCPHEVFEQLLPATQRTPGLIHDVSIRVEITLQQDGRNKLQKIRTTAELVHTERLAQNSYHVGAAFRTLNDEQRQALEQYVAAGTGESH